MDTILGQKKMQTQRFLEDGTRIPVTQVWIGEGNAVIQKKNQEKDSYTAIQLGFGKRKNADKAKLGHVKGASLTEAPLILREVRIADDSSFELGQFIKPEEVLTEGDIVDVTGVSKGKGFAGVVKRHHFKGGPRTHGQSDRERAPGSIGQTTTPGRVYKGKRMAGRMGHETVTVKNLEVVEVGNDYILIKGLIPGPVNNLVVITKVGQKKKFVPLYREEKEESIEETPQTEILEEAHVEESKPTVNSSEDENAAAISNEADITPVENVEAKEEKTEDVENSEESREEKANANS